MVMFVDIVELDIKMKVSRIDEENNINTECFIGTTAL